jgi:hypothetical protein
LAVSGEDVSFVLEVEEGPVIAVAAEEDVAAFSAVAAVGSAEGDVFFAAEVG